MHIDPSTLTPLTWFWLAEIIWFELPSSQAICLFASDLDFTTFSSRKNWDLWPHNRGNSVDMMTFGPRPHVDWWQWNFSWSSNYKHDHQAYVHDMCRLTRSKSTLTVDQRPYSFTQFWPNNLTSAICWAIYSTDTLNRADECHLIDTRKNYCLAIEPLRGD